MQAPDVRALTAHQYQLRVGEKAMRVAYRPFVLLGATILVSCGGTREYQTANSLGDSGGPPSPPPTADLPYVDFERPLLFLMGVPASMEADDASSDTAITISPALPAGLTLDASNGSISGTPTALSPGQSYTLTAVNAQGTYTSTVNLEVNDGPLFYPSPAILSMGTAMAPLAPNGTNFLSGYSVSPALPTGLSLDPTTGVISGTPIGASPPSYYTISGADVGFIRQYGLSLAVADPAVAAAPISSAPYNCVHSGGFVGTFTADSMDKSYGLIAIAFTPDGKAHARVSDLTTYIIKDDSDGLEGLSAAMDGSFSINFPGESNQSLQGAFTGPDFISGTYQNGLVSKHFTASRLGGSSSATYRYSGGFGSDHRYRVDFGTVDVTGSELTGSGYQMVELGVNYFLANRQLTFGATINNGALTVTVDSVTTSYTYVADQSALDLGDPYDRLFYIETLGCQLN
jgi:Putative Ig domain